MKSEVETIIKTGRKMVEEKSVPEPHEFSKKIDALKELYNKLGAQITESKTKLENALLTSREIQSDLQALDSWLRGPDLRPQTLELEMSRMQALRDKLNANYREFAADCDPAYLQTLTQQVDSVNERWDRLKKRGDKPGDQPGDQPGDRAGDQPADRLGALQTLLDDIQRELETADTITDAKLCLLQNELRARAEEVEQLRDPLLAARWEELLDKITVSGIVIWLATS